MSTPVKLYTAAAVTFTIALVIFRASGTTADTQTFWREAAMVVGTGAILTFIQGTIAWIMGDASGRTADEIRDLLQEIETLREEIADLRD